ncbi:head-tail connector protein [Saccharospirillum sp. MSK14-1]|uniref:head-tail connector protein n=1 Tax=Saccharospirillum sp. MSK14-1 TaxID=1897632 RepID=UPI000D343D98|nr:head-tail connector protein [Saccharospirillum sp. MSK14-1]
MLITLDELKHQCRLPVEHIVEDDLLMILAKAATDAAEADLNRKLYSDQTALDADADAPVNAMVTTEGIRAGILMIAASLYANREYEVTGTIVSSFSRTLDYLWGPHRWYGEV